jgi:hypothetical protein
VCRHHYKPIVLQLAVWQWPLFAGSMNCLPLLNSRRIMIVWKSSLNNFVKRLEIRAFKSVISDYFCWSLSCFPLSLSRSIGSVLFSVQHYKDESKTVKHIEFSQCYSIIYYICSQVPIRVVTVSHFSAFFSRSRSFWVKKREILMLVKFKIVKIIFLFFLFLFIRPPTVPGQRPTQ